MPCDYACDRCDCSFSVGNYHGIDDSSVYALYCRHCGSEHRLISGRDSGPDGLRFALGSAEIVISSQGEVGVRCGSCNAAGPIGRDGPITDVEPDRCPKCALGTMRQGAGWLS